MLSSLVKYIEDNEDVVMEKILCYALRQDYTKYTSSLKEAWRLSVAGLSKSLMQAIQEKGADLELVPDEDYTKDPASQYGILQASRHKERGVSLDMFIGLKQSLPSLYRPFKPRLLL
jgi:hypothetical protein